MRLQRITYENFRNHRLLIFEPYEGINLLYGSNGSGKTSMLEGIHFCALTKGFVSSADSECLMFSKDYFLLNALFIDESESDINVKIIYTKEKEKQIIVNNISGGFHALHFRHRRLLLSVVLQPNAGGLLITLSVRRIAGILMIF